MAEQAQNQDDWESLPDATATTQPQAETRAPADDWESLPEAVQKPQSGLSKGLDYLGRGLDYGGGLTRTALASLADYVTTAGGSNPENAVSRPGDFQNALVGKGPTTKEYLERTGLPNPSLSDVIPGAYTSSPEEAKKFLRTKLEKGGLADPTLLGTVGMVGDIAVDPLTHAAELVKNGPGWLKKLADTISQPVANAATDAGQAYYKSAFKRPNAAMGDFVGNKKLPSEIAMENGIYGNAKGIEQKTKELTNDLTSQKKDAISKIDNKELNASDAWSPELVTKIQTLMKDPDTREVASWALDKMAAKEAAGPVTPETMWLWQKNLTRSAAGSPNAPGNAFKEIKSFSHAKEIEKQMAQDFSNHLELKAGETSPELGKTLQDVDANISPLLTAKRALRSGAKNEANRKGVLSQVGGALVGGGLGALAGMSGGAAALPAAAGFYGAKALGSPMARTAGGLLLNGAGNAMHAQNIDALIRRGLINQTSATQPRNTWSNMLKSNNGGTQ